MRKKKGRNTRLSSVERTELCRGELSFCAMSDGMSTRDPGEETI